MRGGRVGVRQASSFMRQLMSSYRLREDSDDDLRFPNMIDSQIIVQGTSPERRKTHIALVRICKSFRQLALLLQMLK